MAKKKNRNKAASTKHNNVPSAAKHDQQQSELAVHTAMCNLLHQALTKHRTLVTEAEVQEAITNSRLAIQLADTLNSELCARYIQQHGPLKRTLTREEAVAFLKSQLSAPDERSLRLIDLIFQPQKTAAQSKAVLDAIAQERSYLA